MLLNLINTRRLLFFGGKGGVGKTTVSAATALLAAQQGQRTLLVSTDPAHNLGHLFDRSIGPATVTLTENLHAMELDPQLTVDQHLAEVTAVLRRLMPVQLAGEVDKHIELSRQAPGMQEAAMLEKMAQVIADAEQEYDRVIFDTAPSGHTSRLMALPEMMSAWTEGLIKRRDKSDKLGARLQRMARRDDKAKQLFGRDPAENDPAGTDTDREERIRHILNRRKQRFANLKDTLQDKQNTAFVIVLAAERLPVLESIELYQQLHQTGVQVAGAVINKRSPDNMGGFIAARREQEAQHLQTLQQALPNLTTQEIPLWEQDVTGIEALESFALTLSQ